MRYLQILITKSAALGRDVTQLQPYCLGRFLRDVSVLSLDQLRVLMLEGGLSIRPKDQMHYLQTPNTESAALGREVTQLQPYCLGSFLRDVSVLSLD